MNEIADTIIILGGAKQPPLWTVILHDAQLVQVQILLQVVDDAHLRDLRGRLALVHLAILFLF